MLQFFFDFFGFVGQYRSYYCLHGYWFDQIQSGRTPQDDDVEVWTNLIEPEWQKLNWFSFDSRSLGKFLAHYFDAYF